MNLIPNLSRLTPPSHLSKAIDPSPTIHWSNQNKADSSSKTHAPRMRDERRNVSHPTVDAGEVKSP